jgi:CHAT domain-containing protein
LARLQRIGTRLLTWVLSPSAKSDLSGQDLFLDIGIDNVLVDFPWELLHDDDEFLALKHFLGRFVNMRQLPGNRAPAIFNAPDLGDLKVLVISAPAPRERDGVSFPRLRGARAETDAVFDLLSGAGVEPHYLPDATYAAVDDALRQTYHIIHFTGHAQGGELVLHDANMSVGELTATLGHRRCVFCFVNACQTAAGDTPPTACDADGWAEEQRVFGLVRAFLQSGAYVLGTRWELPDQAGADFATTFYRELLGAGAPIGKAVTEARRQLKKNEPVDWAWASYVYYGDPRLCFRKVEGDEPAAAEEPVGELVEVIENPPSEAEQYDALVAVKELGPDLPDDVRPRVVAALQDVSAQEDAVGSARQLLANQILGRLGAPS